ncbi:MAG: MerR family transcriptional regulator [Pseudomonadota bacterium]
MRLQKLAGALNFKRSDAEFWLRKGALRTKYEKTVAGKFRRYTRENATELAAMRRLVSSGVDYKRAATWAKLIVDEYTLRRRGVGPKVRWFISGWGNPKGDNI